MSNQSDERETGKKPDSETSRERPEVDGAFGKEGVEQTVSEDDRNIDNAVRKREEKEL